MLEPYTLSLASMGWAAFHALAIRARTRTQDGQSWATVAFGIVFVMYGSTIAIGAWLNRDPLTGGAEIAALTVFIVSAIGVVHSIKTWHSSTVTHRLGQIGDVLTSSSVLFVLLTLLRNSNPTSTSQGDRVIQIWLLLVVATLSTLRLGLAWVDFRKNQGVFLTSTQRKVKRLRKVVTKRELMAEAEERLIRATDESLVWLDKETLRQTRQYATRTRGMPLHINYLSPALRMTDADALLVALRLEKRGLVKIHGQSSAEFTETLSLTTRGIDELLYRKDATSADWNVERLELHVGDRIEAGTGATIINRSTLTHSFNRVRDDHGLHVADAWKKISETVEESGDANSKQLVNEISQKLSQPEPNKSVLRALFSGLVSGAPAVKDLSESVKAFSEVFS